MNNGDKPAVPCSRPPTDIEREAHKAFNTSSLEGIVECGLTKLEHFAAMAMQGILASDTNNEVESHMVAQWSLEFAKATLAALEADND